MVSFNVGYETAVVFDDWVWRGEFPDQGTSVTLSPSTEVPTFAQAGKIIPYSMQLAATSTHENSGESDFAYIGHQIGGYAIAGAVGQTLELSFWVWATSGDTFPFNTGVAFQNSGADRSYIGDYTVNSPSTWEYKTISVAALPVGGTWDYTTGLGLAVYWSVLTRGATGLYTAPGIWTTGNYLASTSGQINYLFAGTFFRIADPRISIGTSAPYQSFPIRIDKPNVDGILTNIVTDDEELTLVRPTQDASATSSLIDSTLSTLPSGDGPVQNLSYSANTLASFMNDKNTVVLGGPFYSSSARQFHDVIIPDNVALLELQEIRFCGPGGESESYLTATSGNTPATAPTIFVKKNDIGQLYAQRFDAGITTNYGLILYFTDGAKHLIYAAGINSQMTKACEFVLENADAYFMVGYGVAFLVTSTYAGQGDFVPTLGNTTVTSL